MNSVIHSYTQEFKDAVIRTVCAGLPGPSACVAPNCDCYKAHGEPIFEKLCAMFERESATPGE